MAVENLTTWTETDPDAAMVVGSNDIVWTALELAPDGRVSLENTTNDFETAFTHLFTFDSMATDAPNTVSGFHPWAVTEINETWSEAFGGGRDACQIVITRSVVGQDFKFQVGRYVNSSLAFGTLSSEVWDGTTPLYFTVVLASGTVTATAYSDSDRTISIWSDSVALGAAPTFAWVHQAMTSSTNAWDVTGEINTVDLGLGAVAGPRTSPRQCWIYPKCRTTMD